MANATPFLWKRSAKKNKGMSAWAFPERVAPGETVTVAIAFKGGDGADGRASYQVSEITLHQCVKACVLGCPRVSSVCAPLLPLGRVRHVHP